MVRHSRGLYKRCGDKSNASKPNKNALYSCYYAPINIDSFTIAPARQFHLIIDAVLKLFTASETSGRLVMFYVLLGFGGVGSDVIEFQVASVTLVISGTYDTFFHKERDSFYSL